MRLAQAKAAGNVLDHTVLGEEEIAQLGRFAVTLDPRDIGTFRTPSLRNVADTAPYMHDGSVATLEEAVDLEIYYRSTQMDRPLVLTAGEKADIVEFLRALSSPYANR
jgi:cytochrome c peroxidase